MTPVDPVAAAEAPTLEQLGRVHLVGVGGAGMSGLARLLLARGLEITGCDARDSVAVASLTALGVDVAVGHDPAHLATADTVVATSAVRAHQPELVAARERGLPVLHRAVALAAVMRGRRTAAITGTHGKTTTTSMLTVALQHCGLDPSFAIGGELNETGANAHDGTGDLFVAEADESDGSFLWYRPEVAVVTNVDVDHLDHYGSREAYTDAFDAFVARLDADGHLVAGADDPGAAALAVRSRTRGVAVRTYGLSADADLRLDGLAVSGTGSAFDAVLHGRRLGRVRLRVPGEYNALNAAAALATGLLLGAPAGDLRRGLAAFTGTRRRFESKGTAGGVRVFDDYAHHPSELSAVLRAARGVAGDGRLVVVFQPHLYSRTRAFAAEFGAALGMADAVVVMDVYAAREDPQPGVSGELVAAAVPLPTDAVRYEASWSAVPAAAAALVRAGDVLLTVGAGDVTLVGPEVLELVAAGSALGEQVP